jgi:hypothetical protein
MTDKEKTTDDPNEELSQEADSKEEKPTGSSDQTSQTEEDSSGEDWEKRFKGLQPKHQQLVEEHKDLKVKFAETQKALSSEKTALELKLDEAQAELKNLTETTEGLKETNGKLEESLESLNKRMDRSKLIMSDYPDLAPLEASGLLAPNLEGDELTAALNNMRSLMGQSAKSAVEELTAGATGGEDAVTGTRTQAKGVNDIGEQLMEASRNRDRQEVDRLTKLLEQQANNEIFVES